jgi:hypothetical protein
MSDDVLETIVLKKGGHRSAAEGLCLMEAVAYVRGITHTDKPPCVSPVLGAFGRAFNDVLDDDSRQELKHIIPLLPGTAGNPAKDERRAWMATDWLVRVYAPAFLRLAKLNDAAERLERCAELVDVASAKAAGAAAMDAARAAAWVAAWEAACVADW